MAWTLRNLRASFRPTRTDGRTVDHCATSCLPVNCHLQPYPQAAWKGRMPL